MQATFALTSSLDSLVRREYTCWIHIGFWWPNVFRPIPQTPSPKFMKPWQSSTSLGEKLNLGEFLSRAILSTIVSSVRIPWCNMIPSSVWIQSWNKLWWLVGSLEFYTSTWLKQFRHGSSDKRVDSHQSYPPIWDLALPQIAASYSFERKNSKHQLSSTLHFQALPLSSCWDPRARSLAWAWMQWSYPCLTLPYLGASHENIAFWSWERNIMSVSLP